MDIPFMYKFFATLDYFLAGTYNDTYFYQRCVIMEHSSSPLLMQGLPKWAGSFYRENKVPLLSSFVWGLLAYLFAFTNKLVNHDEVGQLFGKGATVSSGRWGLGALDSIFPNYSMPWIYGILTLLLIGLGVCLIVKLFHVENKLLQVLLAGCITVFPSVIGLFGFMFTSSSYALSFFLCILSLWLLTREQKIFRVLALGCQVASLSIYQSYISIAASLLVMLLIRDLLTGVDVPLVLKKGIGYVAFLIFSLGLYYGATQVVLKWKDVSFNTYAADSITLSLSGILDSIRLAYVNFFRFFSKNLHSLIPNTLSRNIHYTLFCGIFLVTLLLAIPQKKQRFARYALLTLLFLLLPLAINCMYLITSEDSIHTLVLYSFATVYVLAATVMELALPYLCSHKLTELLRRLALDAMAILLAGILVINIYVANESYLNLYLRYENAYSFFTSLTADIKRMPEFTEETKIAIIGSWQSPDYFEKKFETNRYLIGTMGFLPTDYTYPAFLEYYIGFPAEFVTAEESEALRQTEAFQEMTCYPYYGSIGVIDGVIVVKLSD